jgi:GNAT superfamily N-acetyltransferase
MIARVQVRRFDEHDYAIARELYAQLVEHHRAIYDDDSIGGDDPGVGLDEVLGRPDFAGMWVATSDGAVVGVAGLLWDGTESTVEPIVVDRAHRGEGVGRALLVALVEESRRLGATDVNIAPVARNEDAIRAFHDFGFRTLGHVQMFMSLDRDDAYWRAGLELHGRAFEY